MKIFSLLKNLFTRPKRHLPAAAVEQPILNPMSVVPAAMNTPRGYLGAPFPSQTRSLPMAPRSRSKHQLPSSHIVVIPAPTYSSFIDFNGGPKTPSRRDCRRAQAAEAIEQAKRKIMNQPGPRYSQHTKDL